MASVTIAEAHLGTGSQPHPSGEYFNMRSGTNIVGVSFRGGVEASTAVLSRTVQLTFADVSILLPLVRDGKLRALAISSATRSPLAPELPTMHACQLVSYNRLVERLKGLFGLTISEGAIANMLARAAPPFAAAGRRIEAEVRAASVIASDETSARVMGKTHWLWVFGCATAVGVREGSAPTYGSCAIALGCRGATSSRRSCARTSRHASPGGAR